MIVDEKNGQKVYPYQQDFADLSRENQFDYTQAVTSSEFSKFKLAYGSVEGGNPSSLMGTSHVDGSVRVFRFNDFQELSLKHKECSSDIQFKDHFYSANKVTFAQNTKDVNGEEVGAIGGHQPWMLTCSDDTMIHMYDLEKC